MSSWIKNGLWIGGIGLVLWMGASVRAAVVSPVMTAFQATQAHSDGFSINGWVQVAPAASNQNLDDIVHHLSQKTHIRGIVKRERGTGYEKAIMVQKVAGFFSELIAERLASGATYVVIDRVGHQGFQGLNESLGLVRNVLSPYGPLHLSLTLQGTLPHRLSLAQQQQVVNRAFRAIGAQRVNGIQTAHYLSIAGNSGFIDQHDTLQGHSVNIQVALNYNTYLHAEQVDVGTPLVTVTY